MSKKDKDSSKSTKKDKHKMNENQEIDNSHQVESISTNETATNDEKISPLAINLTINLHANNLSTNKELIMGFCDFIQKHLCDCKQDREEVKAPEVIHHTPEPTREPIIEYKLPDSVNPMLDIVSIVKQDDELSRQWLDGVSDQGLQLIKLTAILSQWDQIDRLWDKLASRCKNDKRPPSAQERQLLEKAVETYNLTLNSRQASLAKVELGGSYDYEKQQRGLPTGDKVVAEWLPALVNAAGTVVKKPLVETR